VQPIVVMPEALTRILTVADLERFNELVNVPKSRITEVQEEHEEYINLLLAKIRAHADLPKAEALIERTFTTGFLKGAVFVGHVNTDMDSISGAIGAAHLFGGTAARSEQNYNGEIVAGLEFAELDPPPVFDAIPGVEAMKVCLVDHNEVKQMTPSLRNDPKRTSRIVGLIDHHALAQSFETSGPLCIEVQPWGSMSTIVAWLYVRNNVAIPKKIARILLCAILSDTLNLKSGTTTCTDEFFVAMLAKLGEVDDIQALASRLFKAKTEWIVGLGAYEMIRGDQKDFEVSGLRFSIAVLEVTEVEPVLQVASDLILQLRLFKYHKGDTKEGGHDPEKELHVCLLFIIHAVEQYSYMLVCGGREKYLGEHAFPGTRFSAASPSIRPPSEFVKAEETLLGPLAGMVSRKQQFLPMVTKVIAEAGVPEFFRKTGVIEQEPVVRALSNTDDREGYCHDSICMRWHNLRDNMHKELYGKDCPPPATSKTEVDQIQEQVGDLAWLERKRPIETVTASLPVRRRLQ